MAKAPYQELVAKYLAGELSPAEDRELRNWMSESPENKELVSQAERIWKLTGRKLVLKDPATNNEWQRLQDVLEGKQRPVRSLQPWWKAAPVYLRVAAAIVVLAVLTYFFMKPGSQPIVEPAEQDAITLFQTLDSVRMLYLPDSTKIWLNARSQLSFSSAFKSRFVHLEGEGFFEVKHDTQQPFTVQAGTAVISVLGTMFNLRAYKHEATTEVTLVSGTAKINEASGSGEVVLGPGEKAVYNKETKSLTKEQTENFNIPSWVPANKVAAEKEVKKEEKKESKTKLNPSQPLSSFLVNNYTWKKNLLNETVIEGTISNISDHTTYDHIKLKVEYTTKSGHLATHYFTLSNFDKVKPGSTVSYHTSLMDVFSKQKKLTVTIESATPVNGIEKK